MNYSWTYFICNIYINDLVNASNIFKFTMFADDTTLFIGDS